MPSRCRINPSISSINYIALTAFVPLVLALSAALLLGAPATVRAFHSGGTGDCGGCHTMHNSFEGSTAGTGSVGLANIFLLRGTDQSSTCLNCHSGSAPGAQEYLVSTDSSALAPRIPPAQLTPGGDFAWLKKSYSWTTTGGENRSSSGERHGHNIIATDFGYETDSANASAPGGSYPSNSFHCSSCHDPHGKYRIISNGVQSTSGKPIKGSGSYGTEPDDTFAVGVFRLLGGIGYRPKSLPEGPVFTYETPYAVSPVDYNRAESDSETRVAYGKGTSEWCANCHGGFHSVLGGGSVHPTGVAMGAEIANNYNSYKKTGDLTGTRATAYSSLVPFQSAAISDIAQLRDLVSSAAGPTPNDQPTCFSCHRAHASGWDSAFRYNTKSTFMTAESGGTPVWPDSSLNPDEAQGRSRDEVSKAYYDRPATLFSPFQRSLCNKCHAKD